MCGSDGANVRSGSANKRHDGATGAYAHLNDAGLAALAGFGPQELAEQRATIAKAQGKVGDHHDGQGGLNNFPCGEDQGMTYWLVSIGWSHCCKAHLLLLFSSLF
eukprot:SAG31_NODE_67_length_28318_cov_6.493674_18_plen_105_part_00